uniref:Uncharacterized protein n=1 Tax=Cannabis sativa TaxID=3483 RepID=A0A803NKC1_CANSA
MKKGFSSNITKHNYAVGELSRGDPEAEALKKWLREAQDGPFRGEYAGDVWDLNLDPLTDWFKRFMGSNLAPFASEMLSHFAADLTQLPTKRYAACASSNHVYQIQDMSVTLTAIVVEAGHLSKTLIDHRFTMLEFGGMDEELIAKLKSLDELHQTNLEATTNLTVELKELHQFRDQTRKETAKAARDALLAPITCQHYEKHFDDGVFMCWKANNFEPRLPFYPNPKVVLAQFWEKNKKLDVVLAERRGPRLPP